jgi:DNA-binding HxlR family transcriptional regulator
MSSTGRRSVCPVSCTLDLIGDKWTLLVIRDLFAGKAKFKDFSESPERIATNILTDRLTRLEHHGLISRQTTGAHAGRCDYALTPKGRTLLPVLKSVADWGLNNIQGTRALIVPPPPHLPKPPRSFRTSKK